MLCFRCKQFLIHLPWIWGELAILIFCRVRFLSKNKLLVLPVVILYKKVCKDVIFRGQIVVFLQNILQLSLRFIAHLKYKKMYIIKVLSSLAFLYYVMFRGHILSIPKKVLLKLIVHQWLKNQLPDILFWEFYIHSTYVIKHCF